MSPAKLQFLENLLEQLAGTDRACDLLLEIKESKSADSMDIETESSANMNIEQSEDNNLTQISRRLLNALQDYAYFEGVNNIQRGYEGTQHFTYPLLSPILRILITVQRELVHDVSFHSYLCAYVSNLFFRCQSLIEHILKGEEVKNAEFLNCILQSTMLGVVLHSLITSLYGNSNTLDREFIDTVLPQLMKLLSSVDLLNQQLPAAKEADIQYVNNNSISKKESKIKVETKHPYLQGKNQLKQTVTIKGAQALALHFDARSQTANSSSDVLQLFQNSAMTAQIINPKDRKPFLFSGTSFPKRPIIIAGETVTFLFTANSRFDPKNVDNRTRWGFKCRVTEVVLSNKYKPILNHWLLDIENSLALLCGKFCSQLVAGKALSEHEIVFHSCLESRILRGGLSHSEKDIFHLEQDQVHTSPFIQQLIFGKGEGEEFYRWMEKLRGRLMLTSLTKQPLEKAERFILATMLHHLNLTGFVSQNAKTISKKDSFPEKELFILIAKEAEKILISIQKTGQLENVWRANIEEKPTLEGFMKQWKEEKRERIMEICQFKKIDWVENEENKALEELYHKLQQDIQNVSSTLLQNPYEHVASSIIEKAQILLQIECSIESNVPTSSNYFKNYLEEIRQWLQGDFSSSKGEKALSNKKNLNLTAIELQKILNSQISRAHSRIEGLKFFNQLFQLVSFHSTKQQVLNSISSYPPLANAGHYLRNISAIGKQLASEVSSHFASLFHQLVKIIEDRKADISTRLNTIALVCSFGLIKQDVELLKESHIFSLLQNIVSESNEYIEQQLVLLKQQLQEEEQEDEIEENVEEEQHNEESADQQQMEEESLSSSSSKKEIEEQIIDNTNATKNQEQENLLAKSKKLRDIAWIGWRLLATRCVGWIFDTIQEKESKELKDFHSSKLKTSQEDSFFSSSMHSDDSYNQSLIELQDQVFNILCSELKSLCEQTPVDRLEHGNRSYQLLSLLYLLGSIREYKFLSKYENLSNLISILKTTAEPRTKRLALRLCRKVLPTLNLSSDLTLETVQFFLRQIGSLLIPQIHASTSTTTSSSNQKPSSSQEPNSNTFKISDIPAKLEPKEEPVASEELQFSIYLTAWSGGPQKLIEICQNTLGNEVFNTSSSASSSQNSSQPSGLGLGFGSLLLERQNLESRIQTLLQEMIDEGHVLLKTTSLANCNLLATSITAQGGSVSIESVSPVAEEKEGNSRSNRNNTLAFKKRNPSFWYDGQVAFSLASEYIYLLRLLLDPNQSTSTWTECVRHCLTNSFISGTSSFFSLSIDSSIVVDVIGSLAILGGFTEILRVGGKVKVTDNDNKTGIVISLNLDSAEIVYDIDSSKTPRKFPLTSLQPLPELDLFPQFFPLTIESLKFFTSILRNQEKGEEPIEGQSSSSSSRDSFKWDNFLKSKVLQSFNKLLSNPASVRLFLSQENSFPQIIPIILQLANNGEPSSRLQTLENLSLEISKKIWNHMTKPRIENLGENNIQTMKDLLPHFTYSRMAELLPTGFSLDRVPGLTYRENRRKVECAGNEVLPPFGRRTFLNRAPPSVTELILIANAAIPTHLPEYYFEVTIDKMDNNGSLISIGFLPEGSKNWGVGSYRYQANAKKTTFSSANRRVQNDYGMTFRTKNVIGCGWNRDEKTIYFTRDGTHLGTAFSDVNLGKVYPAVGLSKGVNLTLNFGQTPFRYKFALEGETKEEREKRKQEEKEKLEQQKKEEAERRRKEKEDEYAASVLAAQPLVQMGFDLKMALVALKQTGNNGPEVASNWLVENLNTWNWDEENEKENEDQSNKEKEEEKDKEVQSKEEEVLKSKASENLSNKDSIAETTKKIYDTYVPSASSNFILKDNFSYDDVKKPKDTSKTGGAWEDSVIPAIKGFMEKDGFAPLEVEDYLAQIRNALSSGNDQQAKGIVMQILGDASSLNIQFPSSSSPSSTSKPDKPLLKIEEVKRGMWISVSSNIPSEIKHWIPQMDHTKGMIGQVKQVDHQESLVLLEFYISELACLEQYW